MKKIPKDTWGERAIIILLVIAPVVLFYLIGSLIHWVFPDSIRDIVLPKVNHPKSQNLK